jgi:hypothetical protein
MSRHLNLLIRYGHLIPSDDKIYHLEIHHKYSLIQDFKTSTSCYYVKACTFHATDILAKEGPNILYLAGLSANKLAVLFSHQIPTNQPAVFFSHTKSGFTSG